MSAASGAGPSAPVGGGCLCGRVRFEIGAAPLAQSLCHCRSCRRACGATPVAWLVLPAAALRFVAGRPARHRSSPGVERGFCRDCGTPLTYRVLTDPDTIDLTLCSLDDPARFAPTREVWVKHRLPWVAAAAGRPRFARGSADGPPLANWAASRGPGRRRRRGDRAPGHALRRTEGPALPHGRGRTV